MIIGIDPGNEQTGWCKIRVGPGSAGAPAVEIIDAGKQPNACVRDMLMRIGIDGYRYVVIENIQSYGGQVGRTTLDTCIEIGRYVEICEQRGLPHLLIPRPEYARWMADGARKVNDSVLRQALMLRYGGDKKGEPLHLLKGGGSDKRSAFAVAAYAVETGMVA